MTFVTTPIREERCHGESSQLTEEIIRKYSTEGCSYFFCGPPVMFFLIDRIMKEMGVPLKRFRHDATAQPAVKMIPGFPMDQVGKRYKITVMRGIHEEDIRRRTIRIIRSLRLIGLCPNPRFIAYVSK